MEVRKTELEKLELKSYIQKMDKEITMILQSIQWDRMQLLEDQDLVACCYDTNHRIPPDKKLAHEKECFLRCQGYSKEDKLLPDPLDESADTLVKLDQNDIKHIIEYASQTDPGFRKGEERQSSQPQSLERLQLTYTADERRAIHDAVVNAVPSCHNLADLAIPSSGVREDGGSSKVKSRREILAELRDMKRRRAKYRVTPKTRNYSDVLRDVITTQMDLYSDAQTQHKTTQEYVRIKKEKRDDLKPHTDSAKYGHSSDDYKLHRKDTSVNRYADRRNSNRNDYHNNYRESKYHRQERSYSYSSARERREEGAQHKDKYKTRRNDYNHRENHDKEKSRNYESSESRYFSHSKSKRGNSSKDRKDKYIEDNRYKQRKADQEENFEKYYDYKEKDSVYYDEKKSRHKKY